MEHYFDAAKVFVLAESAKNETLESRTDDSGLMSQIPDSTWPLSNDDSYDHERLLQLTMLFLVLFFLVRKLSKSFYGTIRCLKNVSNRIETQKEPNLKPFEF